jgi:hypothetical protein
MSVQPCREQIVVIKGSGACYNDVYRTADQKKAKNNCDGCGTCYASWFASLAERRVNDMKWYCQKGILRVLSLIVLLGFITMALSGCGGGGYDRSTPEATFNSFIKALKNKDVKAFEKLYKQNVWNTPQELLEYSYNQAYHLFEREYRLVDTTYDNDWLGQQREFNKSQPKSSYTLFFDVRDKDSGEYLGRFNVSYSEYDKSYLLEYFHRH